MAWRTEDGKNCNNNACNHADQVFNPYLRLFCLGRAFAVAQPLATILFQMEYKLKCTKLIIFASQWMRQWMCAPALVCDCIPERKRLYVKKRVYEKEKKLSALITAAYQHSKPEDADYGCFIAEISIERYTMFALWHISIGQSTAHRSEISAIQSKHGLHLGVYTL